MMLAQYLVLGAVLFAIGIYGVLTRRNGVMLLMAVELVLSAVNINLVAYGTFGDDQSGQTFALFIVAIAAVEVAVGLAIVLLVYRGRTSVDVSEIDELKG